MNSPDRRLDTSRPGAARRYNALLGGKDNFEADRVSAERIRQELPSVRPAARELRRFLQRAVHFLAADCGIRQFVDIGCGYPHAPNVHEIAQAVNPTSRVAYVDPDPMVGAHARALMTSHHEGAIGFIPGSLDDADAILADDNLRELIDFTQPVAVLLLAVLHFVYDDQQAHQSLDRIKAALPQGSYVAVSHVTFDPLSADHAARLMKLAEPGADHGPFRARTQSEIAALLGGLEIIPPGLVSVVDWWPRRAPRPEISVEQAVAYGAVAQTPRVCRTVPPGGPP
ncbi:SAM-dependent methyltransferase [Micromonosporaceae bacterium Da 78-11]